MTIELLRKLRFGQQIETLEGVITRNRYGFMLRGAYISKKPSEALGHILNYEDDPYDDTEM